MQKTNIFFQLLVVFVFGVGLNTAFAQDTLVESSYKTRFRNNIRALSDLYCWNIPDFYQGKFQMNSVDDFDVEFENLRLSIFPKKVSETNEFYLFLEDLPLHDRQNLIRYFSYNEKYFESVFQKYGLPPDLKYLAPAISAMNTNFTGPDRKAGIWQITHFDAILNGLRVNRLVDERLNEHFATPIYARIIQQNQKNFGSVELAVLARWFGAAKIRNAISFAGNDKSVEGLLQFLPDSTLEYIGAFQATALFLKKNKFKPAADFLAKKNWVDTVSINRQIHFKQISQILPVTESQLQFLNPQFRFEIVPGNRKMQKLVIPAEFYDDFVIWQDSIYKTYDSTLFTIVAQKIEYPPAPNRQYLGEPVKDLEIEGKTKIQYRLKTGDVLGIIAEKYDVRVEDLKYWNNISNERKIQAGKKLDIFVDDDKADYYRNIDNDGEPDNSPTENIVEKIQQSATQNVFKDLNSAAKIEHIIKSGESPFTIAKKYEGVTPDDILKWNNIDDARKIQIGQKLIIYQKK